MLIGDYATPAQVAEALPGISVNLLAQMRFRGDGPKFYKPSPRRVLYNVTDVEEWLSHRQRTRTGADDTTTRVSA